MNKKEIFVGVDAHKAANSCCYLQNSMKCAELRCWKQQTRRESGQIGATTGSWMNSSVEKMIQILPLVLCVLRVIVRASEFYPERQK